MITKQKFIPVLILLLVAACSLYAGEPDFNVLPRAKTLSLNGLYYAGSDGSNSILNNPAGLVLMSKRYFEFSVADNVGRQKFEGDKQGLHQTYEDDYFAVNGSFAWAFSPDFVMAISYQRALNYNVNWPFAALQESDSASSFSVFELYNNIRVNAASVSGAVRLGEFSVGITVSAYQVKQETAFPRVNLLWYDSISTGLASYQFKYNEDAWTFGFNAGLTFEVSDEIRIGLMTRSGYTADLSGDAQSNMFADIDSITASKVDLSSKFEMPWVIGGGVVYNINEHLIVNADLQYNLWSGTPKSINYKFNNPKWQSSLTTYDSLSGFRGDKLTLDFKNTVEAGVGLEYLLSDISLRIGYRFDQSPNSESTYNYLFPAVNQNWFSIGIGYTDQNLTADLGISYAFGMNKSIQNSKIGFNGNYNSSNILPALTIKYVL